MGISLEQVVDAVCASAQWGKAAPDDQGVYSFSLESDLELRMLSPNGSFCIFWGPVAALPHEESEQNQLVTLLAKWALAACRERVSVLSLHDNTVVLHRRIDLADTVLSDVPMVAQGFLNDLAWWKQMVAQQFP